MKPCRHRRTWLIAGGYHEWCYECGALRRMEVAPPNSCYPVTRWTRPTGIGGDNPWPPVELNNRKARDKR